MALPVEAWSVRSSSPIPRPTTPLSRSPSPIPIRPSTPPPRSPSPTRSVTPDPFGPDFGALMPHSQNWAQQQFSTAQNPYGPLEPPPPPPYGHVAPPPQPPLAIAPTYGMPPPQPPTAAAAYGALPPQNPYVTGYDPSALTAYSAPPPPPTTTTTTTPPPLFTNSRNTKITMPLMQLQQPGYTVDHSMGRVFFGNEMKQHRVSSRLPKRSYSYESRQFSPWPAHPDPEHQAVSDFLRYQTTNVSQPWQAQGILSSIF